MQRMFQSELDNMCARLPFVLHLMLLFAGMAVHSQDHRAEKTTIDGFEYIEIVKGLDDGELPLLIVFHYSGGNPTGMISYYDELQAPVRIILPRGNHKKREGFSYFPPDYYQKDSVTQYNVSKAVTDSLAKFIQSITMKYRKKAVVSGISQGGDISFLLARYYPDFLSAAFPFAAVINSNLTAGLRNEPVGRIPIYIFQGESDKIVSVATTRKRIAEVGEMLDIQLRTYPGLGHDISAQMKSDYSKLIDYINGN
jgi:phospholipase/carboxylesterase